MRTRCGTGQQLSELMGLVAWLVVDEMRATGKSRPDPAEERGIATRILAEIRMPAIGRQVYALRRRIALRTEPKRAAR